MNWRREEEATKGARQVYQAADMRGASLKGASLQRAHLAGANLDDVNLTDSDLRGAHLRKASLRGAKLERADLSGANLGMADLRFACLEHANLFRVNLCRANLLGARLAGARLENVDLAGAILPDGTFFSYGISLSRYTDPTNPEFASTLAKVETMEASDESVVSPASAGSEGPALTWSQIVDRTYGSLAHDPIIWNPPIWPDDEVSS